MIASRQPETFLPFVSQRLSSKLGSAAAKSGEGYISHYGAWHGNAGDVMIVYAQQALLNKRFSQQKWVDENHKKKVEAPDIERINNDAKLVIVGGGGLLLPDRHRLIPNTDSDWLWNISMKNLAALQKPLIGFAIGYNRMKGQDDFRPFFNDHIAATIDRSVFFGLRNTSSLEKLATYLPSRLVDRLVLQPCPTNLMSRVDPPRWAAHRDPKKREVVFVLFMGFARLGIIEDKANIRRVAQLAKRLHAQGWDIHIATHTNEELAAIPAFEEECVPFTHKMLDMMSREAVVQYYRSKNLVIGMRGHGVMLPYGLGVPVMGIINHVKVRYFLEEVKLGEYAVDLEDPVMTDKMFERVQQFDSDRQGFYDIMDREQQRLWDITERNLDGLEPYFNPA
ncbi:polysaccharide pyruvyl transferase family protein [Croceicoccus sp. Ery5]|uniref:polysaccharide pyruvyl transferase family protein n=1 Tax=Croceicoccus sp. Ery5 TaxID=1703340 RepID=UPI001E5BF2B8|nr:polysaccharide pyruvyl transferase family protein [Croceicoccus sp. Ery5]